MAKKKKHKKKSVSVLTEIDKSLDGSYETLIDEIQDMQMQLYLADQKAKKKARKKIKKDPNYFKSSQERMEARKEVIERMEGDSLLDRIINSLKDLVPLVIVISRLVASLILSILSLDVIKVHIKPETLQKMQKVYQLTTSVK